MAFIPIPRAIKATLQFNWEGQIVEISIGWSALHTIDHIDLTNVTEGLTTWFDDFLSQHLTNGLSLFNINATDQSSESGESLDTAISPAIAGVITGASAPANAAGVITFRTDQRGRSFRGRNYIPGLPMSALSNVVTLTPTAMTQLLTDYAHLVDVENFAGLQHSVLSRYHNKAPRTEGVATQVTSITMDSFLDSQRRRLAGRGT